MYILTSNFLYESENVTSIRFESSDEYSSYIDFNNRQLVVKYTTNLTYSDLSISGYQSLSSINIEDGLYLLRKGNITINNVKYYLSNDIKVFSQVITKEIPSGVYVSGPNLYIIVSPDTLPENYSQIINNSNIYISGTPSLITNFSSVYTKYDLVANYDDTREYNTSRYAIMEQDIVSAFADSLTEKLPDFIVTPELQENSDIVNKSKICFYKAMLSSDSKEGDYSRVFRNHPEMGDWKRCNILVNVEFLFDDIENYLYFRNKRLYELGYWNSHLFKLKDSNNNEYNCIANWEYSQEPDLDRSPETKVVDTSNLYSLKCRVTLIGYIMESISSYPLILRTVMNIYSKYKNADVYHNVHDLNETVKKKIKN